MRVSVIVPAFNESETIGWVLEGVNSALQCLPDRSKAEILVVDDGSDDDTADIAAAADARVLRHRGNQGYGAALKTGFSAASGDFIVTIDGDGQHDPADIPKMLEIGENCDMVMGTRPGLHGGSPIWRYPGKWLLGCLVNYLTGRKVADFNCGFRVFRRDSAYRYLHLCPDGFSFSTTMTIAMICSGDRTESYEVSVKRRAPASTSRVNVGSGLATGITILRLISLFEPLKLFLPASFLSTILGVVWGAFYVARGRGLSVGALMLIQAGLLLFFMGMLIDQVAALRRERHR